MDNGITYDRNLNMVDRPTHARTARSLRIPHTAVSGRFLNDNDDLGISRFNNSLNVRKLNLNMSDGSASSQNLYTTERPAADRDMTPARDIAAGRCLNNTNIITSDLGRELSDGHGTLRNNSYTEVENVPVRNLNHTDVFSPARQLNASGNNVAASGLTWEDYGIRDVIEPSEGLPSDAEEIRKADAVQRVANINGKYQRIITIRHKKPISARIAGLHIPTYTDDEEDPSEEDPSEDEQNGEQVVESVTPRPILTSDQMGCWLGEIIFII